MRRSQAHSHLSGRIRFLKTRGGPLMMISFLVTPRRMRILHDLLCTPYSCNSLDPGCFLLFPFGITRSHGSRRSKIFGYSLLFFTVRTRHALRDGAYHTASWASFALGNGYGSNEDEKGSGRKMILERLFVFLYSFRLERVLWYFGLGSFFFFV